MYPPAPGAEATSQSDIFWRVASVSQGYSTPQTYHHASQSSVPLYNSSTHAPTMQPNQGAQEATLGQMYHVLEQTRQEIKSVRGWHGSRLAVAGGVVGGIAVVGGAAAAVVATGGIAAVPVAVAAGGAAAIGAGVAAGGVGVAVGGTLLGAVKTQVGKRQCKKNPVLMEKLVLLAQIKDSLKQQKYALKSQHITMDAGQRQLYRDLKKVCKKVDRSSFTEITKMLAKGGGAFAGAAVGTVMLVGLVAVGAGDGPSIGCWSCGGGSSLAGINSYGSNSTNSHGSQAPSGISLSQSQRNVLSRSIL